MPNEYFDVHEAFATYLYLFHVFNAIANYLSSHFIFFKLYCL